MVKHTQTNCLSVFDHFVGLALKELTNNNLITSLCSVYIQLHRSIAYLLIDI